MLVPLVILFASESIAATLMLYERSMYEGYMKYACAFSSRAFSSIEFKSLSVRRLKSFIGGSGFTKIESGSSPFLSRWLTTSPY